MKVTFTCQDHPEHVYYEGDVPCANFNAPYIEAAKRAWDCVKSNPCPRHTLTYGPLTEEMVAEALIESAKSRRGMGGFPAMYEAQARFVLRLLRQDAFITNARWSEYEAPSPREWLLELARKP